MGTEPLKLGVSGMMRVKNDAQFIDSCIESCIDALDELVIVYNDCTDNSPEIIELVRRRYPEKIKVYPYEHHIMALSLTKDEYDYVCSLPDDDPALLCNYYNFALEKVSYCYAIKIDADQLYFTERLKEISDWLRDLKPVRFSWTVMMGLCTYMAMKISTVICRRFDKTLPLIPGRYPEIIKKAYDSFVRFCATRFDANIMVSGVNVVEMGDTRCVPLGCQNSVINILPPFNGTGDHIFFKVSEKCYYKRFVCEEYSKYRSENYTVIEQFVCPGMYLPGGYLWFHLNMARPDVHGKIEKVYHDSPSRFINLDELVKQNYYQIEKKIPADMFGRDARSFFQFTYAMYAHSIRQFLHLLS